MEKVLSFAISTPLEHLLISVRFIFVIFFKTLDSFNNQTVGCKLEPPTPEDRDPDIPTAAATASVTDSEMNELKLKRSPSSHDISQSAIMDNGHNDTNSNTELSSQTDLISNHIGLPCTPLQSVNDTNIDNNDSVLKFDSDNEMPELLMNNSINFVKNVLNTQPIVALSALTKVYQVRNNISFIVFFR